MQKPHQKILLLAKVMHLFKSGSQYNYYTAYACKLQIAISLNNLKDEVSLWVLFSRACFAVTYISNTTLVKSA